MDQRISYCVDAEVDYARARFPNNKTNFGALVEEVGELAKALLETDEGKADGADVFAEGIQVIAMAIRVIEEGSAEYSYKFDHSFYQRFNVNKLAKIAGAGPE